MSFYFKASAVVLYAYMIFSVSLISIRDHSLVLVDKYGLLKDKILMALRCIYLDVFCF